MLIIAIFTLTSCNKEEVKEKPTSKVDEPKQEVVAEVKTESGVKEEPKVEVVENTWSIEEKLDTKDLWNNFYINQTENETNLIYSWNKIYSWSHISKENPFVWDEWCEKLTKINESSKVQWAELRKNSWNKLWLDWQKRCIKENLSKNISVWKSTTNNLFIISRALYETTEIKLFDSKTSQIYEWFDNLDTVKKVEYIDNRLLILYQWARGGESNLVLLDSSINWKWKTKKLFDWNDINQMVAKDFEILKDNKVKIIYDLNWKTSEKIVSIN